MIIFPKFSILFFFFFKKKVVISCAVYFLVIFGGQRLLRQLPAFKPQVLKIPFQIHNALLTVVSGALLMLVVEQALPKYRAHGFFYTVCSPQAWDQKTELIYYMNYLVKYWELLDTVFLVLKKKKLGKEWEHVKDSGTVGRSFNFPFFKSHRLLPL